MSNRINRAFTLIELLVVVLILGILVAVALPAYLGSIRDAKLKTANANTRMLATAYQSLYVRGGGIAYNQIDEEAVIRELGGQWPPNPCSDDPAIWGYDIGRGTAGMRIQAKNEEGSCDATQLIVLGTPE